MACDQVFYMKIGDLLPDMKALLIDGHGNPAPSLDTAQSIKFDMWLPSASAKKIDGATAELVDAETGEVKYVWADGDTDTAGQYDCQWIVTWGDGRPQHFPGDDNNPRVLITSIGPIAP